MKSSKISGFYKLSIAERLNKIKEFAELDEVELKTLQNNPI